MALGSWAAGYETVFDCSQLKRLHIEGFGESTCENVGRLANLEGLSLARGKLASLVGLAGCSRLRGLQLAHLRKLADIGEIVDMHAIDELELVESLPLVHGIGAVQGKANLRRLDLRGLDDSFADISWLRGMTRLNVLGLRNVASPDWDAIFASPELKKVALTFERPLGITMEEVREAAIDHGLTPTSVKPMGPPTKPVGFVVEFRPEGSTQNLWFWNDSKE